MSLLTGHRISPPMCGTGDCRDGDKLLCNSEPLRRIEKKATETRAMIHLMQSLLNLKAANISLM